MTFNTSDQTVRKTSGWFAPPGADPFTHFIQGEAAHGGWFDMPVITHVKDNLYHGGFVDNLDLGDAFDVIVSMYPWEKYPTNGETFQFKMYDGYDVDTATLGLAVAEAEKALNAGKKVLVHCQAGLNRSSLVVARILMRQGMTADEAIALLREKRSPTVLCNRTFEAYLRSK